MKILDVRAIPLSYWCEKPYVRAAGEQVARHTLDSKGSTEVARALGLLSLGMETEVGAYGFHQLITQRAVDIMQPDIV